VQWFNNRAASPRTRSKSEHGALGTGCRTRGRISREHFAAVRTLLLVLLLELLVALVGGRGTGRALSSFLELQKRADFLVLPGLDQDSPPLQGCSQGQSSS